MNFETPWRIFPAIEEGAKVRLDVWLAANIEGLSRQRAKEMVAEGAVTVNGRILPKGSVVNPGDQVVLWRPPHRDDWYPEPDSSAPLTVHYEDRHLVAVEKPSGIPSVPLHATETGTLAGRVVHRFPECRVVQRRAGDGGLVQRLDRETSGIVLAARSQSIHDDLVRAQRGGHIEKTYLALAYTGNEMPPAIIDSSLAATARRGRKMVPSTQGLPARTAVAVLERYSDWCLVEAVIHRGVRHQIRAHLAGVGCPIAGDSLYGAAHPFPSPVRLFLHAHRIHFIHPGTGSPLSVISPLPRPLHEILKTLKKQPT